MADVVFHDGGLGFAGVSLYFQAVSPAGKEVMQQVYGYAAEAVEIPKSAAPLLYDRFEKAGLVIQEREWLGSPEQWKAQWEG